jgi:hydrogenase maturation factor
MSDAMLPLGKLPPELLADLLARAPVTDPEVVQGPGVGLDCAVVELGEQLLVCKSDPVTFVTDQLGHYLVQVNANDLATTGARPRWLLLTLLLPEGKTTASLAEEIMGQTWTACRDLGIALIGGHSEITPGLHRPIASGTLIGVTQRGRLISPRDARAGDRLLLTKSVPIEGTAILAREFPQRLRDLLTPEELHQAQRYLFSPGISVVRDAETAIAAGRVSAMHDPTEGGLNAALWELAEASGCSLRIDPQHVRISPLSARICRHFGIDPLATIASGALLLTAPPADARRIAAALGVAGIPCAEIGEVGPGPAAVYRRTASGEQPLPWPRRDGLARVFEARS